MRASRPYEATGHGRSLFYKSADRIQSDAYMTLDPEALLRCGGPSRASFRRSNRPRLRVLHARSAGQRRQTWTHRNRLQPPSRRPTLRPYPSNTRHHRSPHVAVLETFTINHCGPQMLSHKEALRNGLEPTDAAERLWLLTSVVQYLLATRVSSRGIRGRSVRFNAVWIQQCRPPWTTAA